MMQTLLEDRFKLRIHRETKDVPVYELTVGKGGPKLQATKEGSCVPDSGSGPPPLPGPGQLPLCGFFRFSAAGIDTNRQTMEGLSRQFSVALDREVIEKTGIAGAFDIHLELSRADLFPFDPGSQRGVNDPADPSTPPDPLGAIRAAVQKLGLKLEPVKSTSEFLVIDHMERPSEN